MSIMFQPGESVLGKYNILDDKKGNAYVTTRRFVIGKPKDEGIDSEFEWSQVLEVNRSTNEIIIQTNVTDSQGAYQSFSLKFDNVEEIYNTIQSRSQQKNRGYGSQGGFTPSPLASKYKNPTTALLWAFALLPGIGVIYAGKIKEGILFLLSGVLVLHAFQIFDVIVDFDLSTFIGLSLPLIPGIIVLYIGKIRAGIILLLPIVVLKLVFVFESIFGILFGFEVLLFHQFYFATILIGFLIFIGIDICAAYYGYSRAKIYNTYVDQHAGKAPW